MTELEKRHKPLEDARERQQAAQFRARGEHELAAQIEARIKKRKKEAEKYKTS